MISVKYIASSDEFTISGSNGHIAVIPYTEFESFKEQMRNAIIERGRCKGAVEPEKKEDKKET